MGALCSNLYTGDRTSSKPVVHGHGIDEYAVARQSETKSQAISKTMPSEEPLEKQSEKDRFSSFGFNSSKSSHGEPQLSRSSSQKSKPTASKPSASPKNGSIKVKEMSSFLGKASTAGIERAVEVLDTLGSSVTSLNSSSQFATGVSTKSNKISILAFEVANTIVKAANLMESLSKESMKHLKEVILVSEGVQRLISTDMDELLRFVAADKRKELTVISAEVVRFGNRCKDPQWHNLERYLEKMESDFTQDHQLKQTAPLMMQHLMLLVRSTAELYHESRASDKYEQDYKRKLREEEIPVQRGENLQILKQELKSQRKHVENLKKKSLWSKSLEEVIATLVDVIHFLHLEIHNAFQLADGGEAVEGDTNSQQCLGSAGLALHYANIITQIDTLVLRSSSVPQNLRDALYQGLPLSIKNDLRSMVQSFQINEELTVPQIKAEMEKTLQWLVPFASNTSRAHHGFGWVGEWANAGTETNGKFSAQKNVIKIETLHHADKKETEAYILHLLVWLHHLISQYKSSSVGMRSPSKSPIKSPPKKRSTASSSKKTVSTSRLTREEKEILRQVKFRKHVPGVSKSQDFGPRKSGLSKHDLLSKSSGHSPSTTTDFPSMSELMEPDFDFERIKVLDAIDRVEGLTTL